MLNQAIYIVYWSCDESYDMYKVQHDTNRPKYNSLSLTTIIKTLCAAQIYQILSLLDLNQSTHQISATTGLYHSTISWLHSRLCSTLLKSSGGHPSVISPADMWHAILLISTGKADTAVQVTKTLQDIKNQPVSAQTIYHHLKQAEMTPVWMVGLCNCTSGLDCGGLEACYMVRWDQD